MARRSILSAEQRQAAVALFESGYGKDAVATSLGVSRSAAGRLWDRWRIWGGDALTTKTTRRSFSGEFKLEVVRRFLAGETMPALAQEYTLSSPQLIETWVRAYRAEGELGLRPKPKGRPKRVPAPVPEESELDRLRRENERLRAEVAYLGKLQALRSRERR